jgi:hypothetical protein
VAHLTSRIGQHLGQILIVVFVCSLVGSSGAANLDPGTYSFLAGLVVGGVTAAVAVLFVLSRLPSVREEDTEGASKAATMELARSLGYVWLTTPEPERQRLRHAAESTIAAFASRVSVE